MEISCPIVVVTVSLLSLSLIWWLFFHRIKATLTYPLTKWPLLGHLGPLLCTNLGVHDYATYLLSQCNYTAELQGPSLTNLSAILTSDPDNIHYILSSNASNFNKGVSFKSIFEMWGNGIMVAEADSWRFQRRLNGALLRQNGFLSMVERSVFHKLETGMFPVLDLAAAKLGFQVDLQDVFQRFTMDVICKLLLGIELNSLSTGFPEVRFSKAFEETSKAMFARHFKPEMIWRLQRWIGVGIEGRASKAEAIINNFIYNQISSKRERVEKKFQADDDDNFDMISSFMKVEEEQASVQTLTDHATTKISDRFLRDSIMNMMTAGRSPISTALTWFFWLVATHPFVENKLRKELKQQQNVTNQLLGFQEINKLVYLHAAICETLRLYPSSPFNHRAAIKPDTLPSGHLVKKGTKILVSVYSQGRMEKIWGADCLEFNPERWISDKGEIVQVGSNKFTAFGAGPRFCIGKDVALMEMKMAIVAIIRNYHFEAVEGHFIAPANSTVMYMKNGFKVHVSKFNNVA
ncbi:unnamed protein product [Rhodiola kirilowii]